MKELYRQGLANHSGPESCAGHREVTGEALTGGNAGQPLSCEITSSRCRRRKGTRKATPWMALICESSKDLAQSETLCMRGHSLSGNREILEVPYKGNDGGRSGKAKSRTPDMHASRKSDRCIVPKKHSNNDGENYLRRVWREGR